MQNRSGLFQPKSEADSASECGEKRTYGCLASDNYENTDRYVSDRARDKLAAFLGKKPRKKEAFDATSTVVPRPTV